MKSHDKDFFVGIYSPIDVRRNILEGSKEIVKSLQNSEKIHTLRQEKIKVFKEMTQVMAELNLIIQKFEKKLPKTHIRKSGPETKTPDATDFFQQIDMLGKELKDVEKDLESINKY